MTRNIHLSEEMGQLFGTKWRLNCKTIQEAMHAIDCMKGGMRRYLTDCTENGVGFTPPNPSSVLEEEDPLTVFKSKKVFIGKRNHQTEKPQDILEFFLKYWTDEGDVVLDPTMGSGSTGVACKKLGREFIGIELDEKYFNVAVDRING